MEEVNVNINEHPLYKLHAVSRCYPFLSWRFHGKKNSVTLNLSSIVCRDLGHMMRLRLRPHDAPANVQCMRHPPSNVVDR